MSSLAVLTPPDIRRVLALYRDVLRSHQEVINRLNVYPVPDGDTGTNMALTMESVVAGLDDLAENCSMADLCHAVSHGSLMGARGNSGVILSQLLRGIAETIEALGEVNGATLATALTHADVLARRAVVRPVEGTILTVAKAAGSGASLEASESDGVGAVAEAARAAAPGWPCSRRQAARVVRDIHTTASPPRDARRHGGGGGGEGG